MGVFGFDYASWTGYLPPSEYLAQLLLSEAFAYLRMHDEPRATEVFSEVTRRFPTSYAAPEADFFHAVANYKATHQPDDLRGPQRWGRVRARYPMSVWRIKQLWSEEPE